MAGTFDTSAFVSLKSWSFSLRIFPRARWLAYLITLATVSRMMARMIFDECRLYRLSLSCARSFEQLFEAFSVFHDPFEAHESIFSNRSELRGGFVQGRLTLCPAEQTLFGRCHRSVAHDVDPTFFARYTESSNKSLMGRSMR